MNVGVIEGCADPVDGCDGTVEGSAGPEEGCVEPAEVSGLDLEEIIVI